MTIERRFIFRGEAVAFGARLDHPHLSGAKATVALAGVGGAAKAEASLLGKGELVRFEEATSAVVGQRLGQTYETRVSCQMRKLDVAQGLIQADVLNAVLVSRYVDGHTFTEDTVAIEGLRIGDRACELDWGALKGVRQCPTAATLRTQLAKDPALTEAFRAAGTPDQERGGVQPTRSGDLACFLARPSGGATTSPGRQPMTVTHGKTRFEIFVGEYLIAESHRRLTLLRIEMTPIQGAALAPPPPPPAPGVAKSEKDGRVLPVGEDEPLEGSLSLVYAAINGQTHP